MKTAQEAAQAERITAFAKRKDVESLALQLVAGLIHPFDYVDKITALALSASIDQPVRLN